MYTLAATDYGMGRLVWYKSCPDPLDNDEGISIEFGFQGALSRSHAIRRVTSLLHGQGTTWLRPMGDLWLLHADGLRISHDELPTLDWFRGTVTVQPEIERRGEPILYTIFDQPKIRSDSHTIVRFAITKEEFILRSQTRIFLSHKSEDKALVRRLCDTLRQLGFDPWFDEDAMPAGSQVHRSLQDGLHDSCAAVFFITPSFKDERYLSAEINHALTEKIDRGDRFAIISLCLEDAQGKRGLVPDPLKPYVWKQPKDELEMLREIIRAVPIQLGPPHWRIKD